MGSERQLRIYQIACLLFALLIFWLLFRLPVHTTTRMPSLGELVVVFVAIYCAWSGFSLQKLFRRVEKKRRETGLQRAALKTWSLGHILRLASALAVCLWAFVLHMFGGPRVLVYTIFFLGVVLLAMWRPGAPPVELES